MYVQAGRLSQRRLVAPSDHNEYWGVNSRLSGCIRSGEPSRNSPVSARVGAGVAGGAARVTAACSVPGVAATVGAEETAKGPSVTAATGAHARAAFMAGSTDRNSRG